MPSAYEMKIPTVKIKHNDGYCLINEKDFNPAKHKLFAEEQENNFESDDKNETTENQEQSTQLLNFNTATEKALIKLPGVGVNRASLIVKNRPYISIEDAKEKLPDLNWSVIESLIEVG